MWPGPRTQNLAAQGEGITNQNQGGLEPGGEAGDGETQAEETEPMTDENGETIPETKPASEEVVPYDDGLGLPDTVAGGGQPLGRRPLRLCRKRLRPQGQKTLRKARGKQSPSRWDAFRRPGAAGDEDTREVTDGKTDRFK